MLHVASCTQGLLLFSFFAWLCYRRTPAASAIERRRRLRRIEYAGNSTRQSVVRLKVLVQLVL